jgi:hypothetical protein
MAGKGTLKKMYRYEWDRPVLIEGRLELNGRRVTGSHIPEFNAALEAFAEAWWANKDSKRPYEVKQAHFRSTYSYVAVDTDDMDDEELAAPGEELS